MKKLLTFLFALMMMSTLTFGAGNLFYWTGQIGVLIPIGSTTDWQNWHNWTLPAALPNGGEPLGANTYPGEFPASDGDWAVFDNGLVNFVTNVPTCTIGLLEVTPALPGPLATFVYLSGANGDDVITVKTPTFPVNPNWYVKVGENCLLDLNQTINPNRVKLICQPGANFWQKDAASFFPADYSNAGLVCDVINKGFVLESNPTMHAEFIQQLSTVQPVKAWVDYNFDDSKYHYICPPITSEFTQEFLPNNKLCRTPNCLCIFERDYVRKYSNGIGWDNWLGNVGTCWASIVDITKGRGYEYYGNPGANPTGKYSFYGTLNSGNPILLPTLPDALALGWNLIGNPYPSALTFGEAGGGPNAGIGWTWDLNFTDPVVYFWDNLNNVYHSYNWYTGDIIPYNEPNPRIIPRSQGFFVRVSILNPPQSDILVGNEARVFRQNIQIGKSVIANNMSVTLTDASSKIIDEALINFRDDANGTEFNRLLDAYKFFNDIANVSQLYFKTTDNEYAAIKTLKLETGNVMYPLYMKVVSTGTYSIDAKNITSFSANTGIILMDNKTNTTVDLKVNPVYTFTATAGDDDARFSLYFTDVLGINNLNDNTFKVYSYDNSIYIQNNDPKSVTGTVLVYDMIGKQMMQEKLNGDAITRINTNLNTGFYIVSVTTDKGVYNQKVFIN